MATEPKAATEDAKIDLFEDDDEFEEFEINEGLNCEADLVIDLDLALRCTKCAHFFTCLALDFHGRNHWARAARRGVKRSFDNYKWEFLDF
ncbi:hypothetical protein U1Q18_050225 [Sarracenia purpurea var. burkii]